MGPNSAAATSPRWLVFLSLLLIISVNFAEARVKDRILQPVNGQGVQRLRGNIHPNARAEWDKGSVDPSLKLERVTIVFKQTQEQQDALNALLSSQQDPNSSNYHKWLTPEQYANQFGISANDMAKVKSWLESQGLEVVDIARARTWVAFSGSASQVTAAFRTPVHSYRVNGENFHANTTEPALPSVLSGMVAGIHGMDDFRPQARNVLKPAFTSSLSGNHFLAPDDIATIYNLKGLYNSGIDGTGQKIAVVGQTVIDLNDVRTFRSVSGLPANDPTIVVVPNTTPPTNSSDQGEANLDLEWAGAVAKNATIIYVNSNNAFTSLIYAVNQNIAPVISVTYGLCEVQASTSTRNTMQSVGQQANAQGQTIVVASGDDGAADCDSGVSTSSTGLSIDFPSALPTSTSVGGTSFNEGSGTYWNAGNNALNGSALSYIPEVGWNDSTATISAGNGFSASGGGKSVFYPKPSWQVGTGVPNDSARDVPDISLAASPNHDGYLVCSQGSCVSGYRQANTNLTVFGGTSAGTPVFAGIVALINQKYGAAQGNVNPMLYALAASSPSAFHDITSGDNKVPCSSGANGCVGGTLGYSAGTGYDQVTGLGTLDASALAQAWNAPSFQLTSTSSSLTVTHGTTGTATFTLAALNNFTGQISLSCTVGSSLGTTACSVSPGSVTNSGTATLTITAPAQLSRLRPHTPVSYYAMWLQSGSFLAFGFLFIKRPQGNRRSTRTVSMFVFAFLLTGLIVFATSCGGGTSSSTNSSTTSNTGSSAPTPLTGTVTVTATGSGMTQTANLTVIVN